MTHPLVLACRYRPILLKNSISLGRRIRLDRRAVNKVGSRAARRAPQRLAGERSWV